MGRRLVVGGLADSAGFRSVQSQRCAAANATDRMLWIPRIVLDPDGAKPSLTWSTAPCTVRASCTNGAGHRTDSTRCAGIIRPAVPRTVPRGQQASFCYGN
jgi:hypothetical protein